MWLRTSCDFSFNISVPTPFILMLRPRSGAKQWVAHEEFRILPSVSAMEFTDIYSNLCQRLTAPQGVFEVRTSAEIRTAEFVDQAPGANFMEIKSLPDPVLHYCAERS